MLTNILLLYMTQEAIAKARAKLSRRTGVDKHGGAPPEAELPEPWRRRMRGTVGRGFRQLPTRH
ncbi:MAG TPA: hypothetical protein VF194_15750 [Ferrovibrio sp.]|jgi:hypothetical protein|uniref:hypothetical protein n=1 Tax=Ferrovibrio sp. TaxID=1917215 RepID=UPI002ED45F05